MCQINAISVYVAQHTPRHIVDPQYLSVVGANVCRSMQPSENIPNWTSSLCLISLFGLPISIFTCLFHGNFSGISSNSSKVKSIDLSLFTVSESLKGRVSFGSQQQRMQNPLLLTGSVLACLLLSAMPETEERRRKGDRGSQKESR